MGQVNLGNWKATSVPILNGPLIPACLCKAYLVKGPLGMTSHQSRLKPEKGSTTMVMPGPRPTRRMHLGPDIVIVMVKIEG
jgi:hypothetical protein